MRIIPHEFQYRLFSKLSNGFLPLMFLWKVFWEPKVTRRHYLRFRSLHLLYDSQKKNTKGAIGKNFSNSKIQFLLNYRYLLSSMSSSMLLLWTVSASTFNGAKMAKMLINSLFLPFRNQLAAKYGTSHPNWYFSSFSIPINVLNTVKQNWKTEEHSMNSTAESMKNRGDRITLLW